MPTGIGVVCIASGLYLAIWKPHLLLGLLLFSTIFPASSALTFGSLWIMPYNILAFIFVLSEHFRRNRGRRPTYFPGQSLLLAFAGLGFLSAFVLPFVFAGIPVYSPRLGSSDETFTTFPLIFSTGNIAQAAYLLLNVATVFAAAGAEKTTEIWRGVTAAFYCLTGTIVLELICMILGIAYPYGLIENNPDRPSLIARVIDPSTRLQGTCGEPSYSGLVLVCFFGVFFYRYYMRKSGGFRTLISAAALLLIRSGSAFASMTAVATAIVLFNPPIRFPATMRLRRLIRLVPIVVIVGFAVSSPLARGLFQEWIVDKPTTGSYEHRTTMDSYSITLLKDTFGVGVGIGSYRPSGLWASLLGNVGVVGTAIFVLLCLQINLVVSAENAWLRWACLAVLLDMGIAIPDINQPVLWGLMAMIVYVSQAKSEVAVRVAGHELSTDELHRLATEA